jgi:peptide/nickel transport system permease protein
VSNIRGEHIRNNPWRSGLRYAITRPTGIASSIVLLALLAAAIVAPVLTLYSPIVMTAGAELQAPSVEHLLGTDEYGRDLLSRTLYGLRVSFVVGALSLILGGTIGVTFGLMAGSLGGKAEALIMRVMDGLLAFPAILMGIAIVAALGPGLGNVALTIALVQLPVFARLAHGTALAEQHKEYVTAAISIGASPLRVMLQHILLNSLSPLFVQAALALGFSVLIEASLSFLGLGIAPPEPSLGSILDASRSKMRHAIWYPLFPGAVLTLLLFAFNGLADMLNDLLNPRQR